jgi:hypothetical protein
MTLSAFEPYGQLMAELYRGAMASDCALHASVAVRRARNRAVNAIFAHLPAGAAQTPRARAWIAHTLAG